MKGCIMDFTKSIWDGKGYALLQKSSKNLRDQYANIKKKTNLNKDTMATELGQQNANELSQAEWTEQRNLCT